MHISNAGEHFITQFEGFSGHVYRDGAGVATIGFGHTGSDVWRLQPLSLQAGYALLRHDLANDYEPAVNALRLPLNQHQFDALVSIAYNCGTGIVGSSHTLGQALRRHDWQAAANAFLLYDHDIRGVIEPGLQRRREAERLLFLSHPLNPMAHKLAKWRAELSHRRDQLKTEKNAGTRHFLIRRIHALVQAIRKHR